MAPTNAGMPTRDGLPAGRPALEDVDLGRRTTGSHNGNDLGGVADLRGEPRRVLGLCYRRRRQTDNPSAEKSEQTTHQGSLDAIPNRLK